MTQVTVTTTPSLRPSQPSPQRIIGRYQVPVNGAVVGTNLSIGALRKGSMINFNQIQVRTDIAGTNTDTITVLLVPRSTQTVDAAGIYAPTAVTVLGVLRGNDAQGRTAGRDARLAEDCEVIAQYNAANNTGTMGDFSIIVPFDHDLDETTF